jgi:pimeloyl-ACP methyl ester carboxylesterase
MILPKLNVMVSGMADSTLVFLPGMGGTTRYWQGRATALEKRHRVILVDPLGFGESPKPRTQYTVERHSEALRRTLAPYAPFTLIGHSMGAVLSIAYAASYPEQIEGLFLIGLPFFGDREQTYRHFRNGSVVDRWVFTNVMMASLACILTRRVFGYILPYLLRNIPQEVAEDLVKHTWRSFTSSLWEVIYNFDLNGTVDRLDPQLPIFCLHGEKDQTAPLAGVMQLARNRPNWHVAALANGDHHIWLRQPDICVAEIESFLGSYRLQR